MNVKKLVASMTPEIYLNVKHALELGKWPDGKRLTVEQKQHCMDMVILYEYEHSVKEKEKTGFLDRNKVEKTPCASSSENPSGEASEAPAVDLIKIVSSGQLH